MDDSVKPEKSLEDAMENLKIDPSPKNSHLKMIGPKDASSCNATSCISSGDAASSSKESENNQDASINDQSMHYYGYCYPGSNGLAGEWDPHNFLMGPAGFEIQQSAGKDKNGPLVYCVPGIQSGYIPYSPFFPGAVVGVDSQYIPHQSYNPNAVSPQPLASSGLYPHSFAYATEMLPSYPLDPSFVYLESFQGNKVNVDSTDPHQKTRCPSQHHNITSKTLPASMGVSVLKGSTQASDVFQISVQNQSGKLGNKGKNGFLYQNSQANMLDNPCSWSTGEKLKAHKLNGQSDFDLLNEQNQGPRKNASKNSSESEVRLAEAPIIEKNDDGSGSVAIIKQNDYNHLDFVTKYEHAFFFVIKSFSEDDIHKSIKYNVWTSTQNGNKKLDSAFQSGQKKTAENGNKCPVFLFFSVNASGQFCGLAEMVGRVDFSKNMGFWQQDKWNGYFPVKWHLIKDIPNSGLRHIVLENNDNKPVTNSRDTQEVKFPQGTEMLNIFKNYSSKTSILDDFDFYEKRQKVMQDKREKQPSNLFHLLPKIPSEVIQDARVTVPRR